VGARVGTGRIATSASAHVAATDSFSLIRLRQRRARIWLTAAGIASLATIYVGPLAIALSRASVAPVTTAGPLPELKIPYETFARLNVPKLHPAPVVAPLAATPAALGPSKTRRVPVVTDTYTLAAPANAATVASSQTSSALANAPLVVDRAGTPAGVT